MITPRPYSVDPKEIEHDLTTTSVLIMPSRVEGFGLVALEAISAGTPTLITPHSGIAIMFGALQNEIAGGLPNWDQAIVPVGGDDKANGLAWSDAVHRILEDREAAFTRADQFRRCLQKTLTWESAATRLTERLSQF
jgi:glycosyltransferase involved in cell wall biosynthesis